MAVIASTGCVVTVGGVDFSDHVSEVSIDREVDTPEVTSFGSSGNREYVAGLKGANVTIVFHQDYAASEVNVTLNTNFGVSTAITVKPTGDGISATNPEYQFNAIISKDSPVMAKVGDVQKPSLTWPITGAITRDIIA
jgi:hypothetical protein